MSFSVNRLVTQTRHSSPCRGILSLSRNAYVGYGIYEVVECGFSTLVMQEKNEMMHDRLIVELGVVLQERRARLNMSQSELAETSQFHRSYISDVERGARNISVRNLSRLARALNAPVSSILLQAEKRLGTRGTKQRKRA